MTLTVINVHLTVACAINKRDKKDIKKYEDRKNDKIAHTYHGFLINFVSNNAGTLEYILSGTGGEAHFLLSGTRVLVGAVFSREFAFWPTRIWRNVSKVS